MTDKTSKELSRRDALKLLGAAAGATVLANLPSKWSTPQLAAGVLPAHAQASGRSLTCWLELEPPTGPIKTEADVIPNPGAGMPLRLQLVLVNLTTPLFGLNSVHNTDANGKVSVSWQALPTDSAGQSVEATWSFVNPSDGTDSCSPKKISFNIFD